MLRSRLVWGGEAMDHLDPVGACGVITAQAVHRRRRVRSAVEVAVPRPPCPLPPFAVSLAQRDRFVPVSGQGRDDEQPGSGQVPLLAVERQVPDPLGQAPRGRQVAGGDCGVGRHAAGVGHLQACIGPDGQRRQQARAPQRAGRRRADFPARQLDGSELVQRGALGQRVTGLAGKRKGLPGRLGSRRIILRTCERLSDADPGLRGQVTCGQRPGLGDAGRPRPRPEACQR